MKVTFEQRNSRAALRIVAIYAIVGALWIFFSDSLLRLLVSDPDTMSSIAIAKGWFYVAVTAGLLFLLIDKAIKTLVKAERNRAGTEARYRQLFHHSGDALMIHKAPDWALGDANPAAIKLFGYGDLAAFLKVHPADLSPEKQTDGEDSRAKSERMLREAFETGESIFPWKCRRADGGEFEVTVRLTRIELDDEPAILAAVRDNTELNRVEAEKVEIERRLNHSQKVESLGVLVGGIAHDFNNLLTVASGNIEIALLDPGNPKSSVECLQSAKTALNRAAHLTRQMLDYARKGKPDAGSIDLNELISENAELLRAIVPRKINMTTELGREVGKIDGDPGQIHQVVMNLITNAAEAITGPKGSIRIVTKRAYCDEAFLSRNILRHAAKPGDYALIEVTDDGVGMDEQTLQRIFEPFYTTKLTGRGLGMSVVMSIIQNHRGALIVDTKLGGGTTMRLCLPLAAAKAGGEPPTAAIGETADVGGERREMKKAVLLVEDEEELRAMCKTMLTLLGYETLEAGDGPQALDLWRKNRDRISVLLLDINMPTLDGLAVLDRIRGEGGKTPVVLTSGMSPAETENRNKANGFLKKPFTMSGLGLALSKAIAEAD